MRKDRGFDPFSKQVRRHRLLPRQLRVVGDRSAGLYSNVERRWWKTWSANLNPMRTGRQIEVLKRPGEIVDDPRVVAVRVDLSITRRPFDANAAICPDVAS